MDALIPPRSRSSKACRNFSENGRTLSVGQLTSDYRAMPTSDVKNDLPGGPTSWESARFVLLHEVPSSPRAAMISDVEVMTRFFFMTLVD